MRSRGRSKLRPYRYLSSPRRALYSTLARSRTSGEISPSLTAFATVTGLVRNSQIVADASTMLTMATQLKTLALMR
jgi:hypothetical protein